jgi:M6 family metalloprotease-like protein
MRFLLPITCAPLLLAGIAAATDVASYRTTATALRAEPRPPGKAPPGALGFLGIEVATNARGRLVISAVADGSPAAQAGLAVNDVLTRLGGTQPRHAQQVRDLLQQSAPGEAIPVRVERGRRTLDLTAQLTALSRPLKLAEQRAILGVQATPLEESDGVRVTRVTTGLPAAKAGLKTGDVLLKLDDEALSAGATLSDLLAMREPGDRVRVTYRRGEETSEFEAELAADETRDPQVTFSPRTVWKRPTYRLAVIAVAFSDTQPNPKLTSAEWEQFFFSTDTFRDTTNATGQRVFGSVNDYFREVSAGQFSVTGKIFDWVELEKPRADYSQGTANSRTRTAFFSEVFGKLLDREGTNALSGFDGLAFIYAGERFATANRGTLFWPHRSTTTYQRKRWNYLICPEGGPRMANISVFCHEFGHMLGLPDLYARPENPGSEGVGTWCAMSNQAGNGRPQHFSAWCKEQLGWLSPVVIDPTVRQDLVLGPVHGATNECFKVLVRPDGSEYLLLENRRKAGFDRSLSAEGLLIWRVVGNRLLLEEAHGVEGPAGPRVFLSAVPYPSRANDAFTPYTTPSSRSQLGGGLPVHLTNIRQLPDGRVAFQVGYEFQ